jgi:hypothetical protein
MNGILSMLLTLSEQIKENFRLEIYLRLESAKPSQHSSLRHALWQTDPSIDEQWTLTEHVGQHLSTIELAFLDEFMNYMRVSTIETGIGRLRNVD